MSTANFTQQLSHRTQKSWSAFGNKNRARESSQKKSFGCEKNQGQDELFGNESNQKIESVFGNEKWKFLIHGRIDSWGCKNLCCGSLSWSLSENKHNMMNK